MYPESPASLMRCPCSRPRKPVEVTPSEMKSSCFSGCCLSSHCIKQILHVNSDLQTKSNEVCSCTCDLITTSGWTMREDHLKAAFYTNEEVPSCILNLKIYCCVACLMFRNFLRAHCITMNSCGPLSPATTQVNPAGFPSSG